MQTRNLIAQIANAYAKEGRDTYHQLILDNLEALAVPPRLEDEAAYRCARQVKSALCSVSCTTINSNHPANDRVWEIESAWGKALHAFNKRLLIQDADTRLLANYLLWNKRMIDVNDRAALELAADKGILRMQEGKVYVVGLYKKVGNNVFTVDANGREHRQYMDTIGRQAFNASWSGYHELAKSLDHTIPELSDDYDVTGCYDGKYGARTPAFTYQMRQRVREIVRQWEEAAAAAAAALRNTSASVRGTASLPLDGGEHVA